MVSREESREHEQCLALLESMGPQGRERAVDCIRSAIGLVPPILFHVDVATYTNLDGGTNLTGKTFDPNHPDCFLHHLGLLPLELWGSDEVWVVALLWLLHQAGGPNRIESINGYQVTMRNVAASLQEQQREYRRAGHDVPADALEADVLSLPQMLEVAVRLADKRRELLAERRLYYSINATKRRKQERAFVDDADEGNLGARDAVTATLCDHLSLLTPAPVRDLGEVLSFVADDLAWLSRPAGGLPSGFEALIHGTVAASAEVFDADFAMSRGIRSLPGLADALHREAWSEIVGWELPDFYCCVVPGAPAWELHGGDATAVADRAWAISARMQYNTWHVMPGNLPRVAEVEARDFLAPAALPDIAVHSDLHHRGHVTHHIRYSLRSPEPVRVGGRTFNSLTDLRVLRSGEPPFDEGQLRSVTVIARFLARLAELTAAAADDGHPVHVTSFDSSWHTRTIIGPEGGTCEP